MRYLKAIVEYDGTNYHGFQRQNNALAIQEVLEETLLELTREKIKVIGASRTDSGVHAEGQVINFQTMSPIPLKRFRYAWNNSLPNDIVIKEVTKADPDFHARHCAKGKVYEYHVLNQQLPSAFERNYSYHIKNKKLDCDTMRQAAEYLVGEYDFTSFRASGCSAKTTVRKIESFIIEQLGNKIIFRIEGNAFLYNMVRIMIGTLIEVGFGKLGVDEIPKILKLKDRTQAGPTAPGHGLRLIRVKY